MKKSNHPQKTPAKTPQNPATISDYPQAARPALPGQELGIDETSASQKQSRKTSRPGFAAGSIVGKAKFEGWIGEVECIDGDRVHVWWLHDTTSTICKASDLKLRPDLEKRRDAGKWSSPIPPAVRKTMEVDPSVAVVELMQQLSPWLS